MLEGLKQYLKLYRNKVLDFLRLLLVAFPLLFKIYSKVQSVINSVRSIGNSILDSAFWKLHVVVIHVFLLLTILSSLFIREFVRQTDVYIPVSSYNFVSSITSSLFTQLTFSSLVLVAVASIIYSVFYSSKHIFTNSEENLNLNTIRGLARILWIEAVFPIAFGIFTYSYIISVLKYLSIQPAVVNTSVSVLSMLICIIYASESGYSSTQYSRYLHMLCIRNVVSEGVTIYSSKTQKALLFFIFGFIQGLRANDVNWDCDKLILVIQEERAVLLEFTDKDEFKQWYFNDGEMYSSCNLCGESTLENFKIPNGRSNYSKKGDLTLCSDCKENVLSNLINQGYIDESEIVAMKI